MSFLKKLFGKEERSMTQKDRAGWENILGPSSSSGVNVTPQRAMSIPAALSAIRLLSESVASLPLVMYRKDRQGGRERAGDHPLNKILHGSPNDRQTAFQFKEVLMLGLLTGGNGYALIDWQENGQPASLWPIEPSRVGIEQDPSSGRITYKISTGTGQIDLPPEEILHIPGLCFDGLRGYSIIHAAREALGAAISELEHGATYFRNAAMPSGVLTHPGALSAEAASRLKDSWNRAYGSPDKAHKTALLEEGMNFEPVTLNNKDSQWLESRAFSVKEIARIFRVPPHLLGDLERASYSSIEAQNLEYLTYTLRPWLTRIEQAINLKLLTPREQKSLYCEFVTADLLRADTKTRFESYEVALRSGWMNINEVRQRENMPPVNNGDVHLVQLNTTTLENINKPPEPAQEPQEARGEPKKEKEYRSTSRDNNKSRIEAAVRELLQEEQGSILRQIGKDSSEQGIKEIIQNYYEDRPEAVKVKIKPLMAGIISSLQREAAAKAEVDTWSAEELEEFAEEHSENFSKRHTGIGLAMALTAADQPEPAEVLEETFEQVLDTRPAKAAEIESTKIKSDTELETYKRAGIERLVWRTEPDACEFCQSLEGKVVGLGEAFVEEGEEIPGPGGQAAGLKARAPRVSPPLHLGCQCSIEPVTGV